MFKEKVKELMNQQNITQKELAELSGITEASVSRYLSGERTPRILFLADRNILANQAFNSFGAFNQDSLCRIKPNEIRKDGKVPTAQHIFFTIFQTFMAGKEPYFGQYERDFFDFRGFRSGAFGKTSLIARPLLFIHINAPFLDIFGCARHSPNKFGSALACTKIPGT